MRLTDLEPQFVRYGKTEAGSHLGRKLPDGTTQWGGFEVNTIFHVATVAEAQGIMFLCPKCFAANNGKVGTHRVLCWSRSRGIADDVQPNPGRWTLEGTDYADLTLNGDAVGGNGARSVLLTGPGCGWHGFITNGEVTST